MEQPDRAQSLFPVTRRDFVTPKCPSECLQRLRLASDLPLDLAEWLGRGGPLREALTLHHQREVEVVVFTAWLQSEISEHGLGIVMPNANGHQLGAALGQAQRASAHFTREQAAAFDRTVRLVRSNPHLFGPESD